MTTTNSPKSLKKITPTQATIAGFVVVLLIMIGGAWYAHSRTIQLEKQIDTLATHIIALEANFSSTTSELQGTLAQTRNALDEERQTVGNIESRLKSYQRDVNQVTNTVEDLEKLSKTDPELLQKYSKVFFLNEHYAPPRLTEIPDSYEYTESKISKIHTEVWPFLKDMLDDAAEDNIKLYVSSAFRSFNEQSALKGQYTVSYGAGTANQFAADQGYSEHQLGTTVDLITAGTGGVLEGFDGTPAFAWMVANAHKYGFTLSYPKGNAYYVYEPWHWRFVGVDLATDLYKDGKHFYDLDQRDIDEYLLTLFE